MDIKQMVDGYIKLRAKIQDIKTEYDDKVKPLKQLQERIEGELLKHFQDTGVDSVKTSAGTAYKQVRTSATVADWDEVFKFIMETENFQMLEHRVSKAAVEDYKAANNDLPPGLNWREEVVVNFRAS